MLRVPLDGSERPLPLLRCGLSLAKQARPSEDAVERRAQLVGEHREKLVLRAVRLFGLTTRRALEALRPLAPRDVTKHHDHADDALILPLDRRRAVVDRGLAPVPRYEDRVVRQPGDHALAEHSSDRLLGGPAR